MLGTALISAETGFISCPQQEPQLHVLWLQNEMAESSVIDYKEKKNKQKKQSVHSLMAISLNWIFTSVPINTNQQAAY